MKVIILFLIVIAGANWAPSAMVAAAPGNVAGSWVASQAMAAAAPGQAIAAAAPGHAAAVGGTAADAGGAQGARAMALTKKISGVNADGDATAIAMAQAQAASLLGRVQSVQQPAI